MGFVALRALVLKKHVRITIISLTFLNFVKHSNHEGLNLTSWNTLDKWVAREFRRTAAYRIMIDNIANGAKPTCTRARIDTFLIGASLCRRTIGADCAFWSASWRCS